MTVAAVPAPDEAALLDPSTPFIDKTVAPAPAQPGLTSNTRITGEFPGLAEPGNIDLTSRPQVKNPDGSVSTVRSASFNIDGKEVLLPTVSPDGKNLTDDQAVELYKKTGQHLGKFDNPDNADRYAIALHNQQAKAYGLEGPANPVDPVAQLQTDTAAVGDAQNRQAVATSEQQAVDTQTADETRAQKAQDAADRAAQLQYNQDALDANRRKQEIAQKSAETPYHEFQISTGRQILASIGQILGGVSYDPHHVNQAVEIYQSAIKQDLETQRAQHENLWRNVEQAVQAGHQLSADQLEQMKEFEQTKAEKLQAIIDKGEALKAFSKNEAGKAALDAEHAKLRAQLDDTIVNATRLERAQKETERHNLATEGLATDKFNRKKAAGAGGGTNRDKAAVELQSQIAQHPEWTLLDKSKAGVALGLPLKATKGSSVQSVLDGITKDAGAGRKGSSDELKDVENAAKPFQGVLVGSARSPGAKLAYDSAKAVSRELSSALASNDPTKIKSAVLHAQEQQTRFLTGAAPTHEMVSIQDQLKGTPAEITAKISSLIGNPNESKAYVGRLITSIDGIAQQRKEVIEAQRAPLEARLQSIVKSDEGRRRAAGILKELIGDEGSFGGGGAKTTKVKLADGSIAEFDAAGKRIK